MKLYKIITKNLENTEPASINNKQNIESNKDDCLFGCDEKDTS